jgi:hypothetical protein
LKSPPHCAALAGAASGAVHANAMSESAANRFRIMMEPTSPRPLNLMA